MEPALLFLDECRNIPDEVLFEEILVRLPVKSLTVYKSVCKIWLNIIESPSFREAHRRCQSRDYSDQILFTPFKSVPDPVTKSSYLLPSTHSFGPKCLIKMTSRPLDVMLPPAMTRINWPDIKLPHHRNLAEGVYWEVSVSILGPLRPTGIYCFVADLVLDVAHSWTYQSLPSAKISICNPATNDYKLVNPFPSDETARLLDLTTKRLCRPCYGFGLAADGDYKVVVIMTWHLVRSGFLSYVYSLKQGSWKKIVDSENGMVSILDLRGKPCFPNIFYDMELCPQVFLNGCWHWVTSFTDARRSVLSFDMNNETFKSMWGPQRNDSVVSSCLVSVLNDHITLVYHRHLLVYSEIGVWMMMEYGDEESWINVHTVNLMTRMMKTLVGISYSMRDDGNGSVNIDKILYTDSGKRLISCDDFGRVEEQPGFETRSCMFWNTLGISAYRETLDRLSPSKHVPAAA